MNPEDMKSAWRDTTRSLSSESKGIKTAGDMRHGTPPHIARTAAEAIPPVCHSRHDRLPNIPYIPESTNIPAQQRNMACNRICRLLHYVLHYGLVALLRHRQHRLRPYVGQRSFRKSHVLPQTASAVCYDSYSLRTHPVWLACICKFGRYLSSCRHGNRGILRTRDRFVPSVSIPARLQKH